MRWYHTKILLSCLTRVCSMTIHEREDLREQVRSLFYHGFNGYMDHAFPEDELQPLTCTGRGKDKSDATNLGINDVCGDYALTLIDSLDMLPLLGDQTAFELGVRNVIESVTFDVDSKVQIFEVTIRVMGGLLSAHQYASLPELNSTIDWYQGELLNLAKDLGNRLLPAFDSPTGIPFPRINLRHGMQTHTPPDTTETCAAGAGSLVLEFALLSELTGEPRFQAAAVKAFREVWNRRLDLDLVGNTLDADSGNWMSSYTGIGAGVDSFYEYALKSWVFLDEHYFYDVWNKSYTSIQRHIVDDDGFLYRNVHVRTGFQITNYIDSLSAFYSGLLVLAGKVEEAIKSHLIYQSLWTRYRGLPERFNYHSLQVEMPWYPLRPEFIESTYYLYRATKDPFYLAVGKQVVYDLLELRQKCGFAVVSNVVSRTFDNRMESFVLSETLKYLYLLFDESHPLNVLHSNWIFSTEGHPFFRPANRSSRYKMSTDFSVQESVFTESCEIPSGPGFYSAVMSRDDIDLSQFKVGLARLGSNLPDYFPPANVTGTCRPIRIRTDFEVLFGTVASSVLNASASIVQIGKELMIKSLLGLKMRFSMKQNSSRVTQLNQKQVAEDCIVIIEDANYRLYTTKDLIQFSLGTAYTQVEVSSESYGQQNWQGMASLHGSALPPSTIRFSLYSLLSTTNADGCLCPVIQTDRKRTYTPRTSAIVIIRGGCSFYQKVLNAMNVADLVIVIDNEQSSSSTIRPVLIDDLGRPMSSTKDYPSLILLSTATLRNAKRLETGDTLIVQHLQHDKDDEEIRLQVRGQFVENVVVSIP